MRLTSYRYVLQKFTITNMLVSIGPLTARQLSSRLDVETRKVPGLLRRLAREGRIEVKEPNNDPMLTLWAIRISPPPHGECNG